MRIKIVSASAGSGKTTRLSELLDESLAAGRARPEAIVATTFTRHAAAELVERARGRLLASGRGQAAHQLLAARIGTVNAVCGGLVADFAFELGLSPSLRVLDEASAEVEQKRALAAVLTQPELDELDGFKQRLDMDLDWHAQVRAVIAAARSNGLGAADLPACATRSMASLDACLGPVVDDARGLDEALSDAIEAALRDIDPAVDRTKVTAAYVELLRTSRRALERGCLRWGEWAKLTMAGPGAKSRAAAAPVAEPAAQHLVHPRLRGDLKRLITLVFDIAARGIGAYQDHKRGLGAVDFVDQEALALDLLRRPDVREALAGQLDLVLVDEFQDTSPLQLAIFLELAALARESVWVGDQKQAIYGFRGTDPALMDAMIESLTSPSSDPDLIGAAVAAVGAAAVVGEFETLGTSYRSRPPLVELTSAIFAPAFVRHDIPAHRTRLAPASTAVPEPPGLGAIVERWPLVSDERASEERRAQAVATGVRDLLATQPLVRDRGTGAPRPATPADVAVLCRTNQQCQRVAAALADLGVAAVLPQLGLLDTAEGHLVMAGLALWVDPRDSVAAAALARLVRFADDLEGLVRRALEAPGPEAFADDPLVRAILSAREQRPDLDPVGAVAAIIDASELPLLAAGWGGAAQRRANLDALRAHAASYLDWARSSRVAPTLVGLVGYFEAMVETWGWAPSRRDHQALRSDADAVALSTWHAAKGREWPLVVLFGLESLRDPVAWGLHVETDAERLDLADPLVGRWLRYWPNPYTTANQGGPVKAAFAASAEYARVSARAQREALRLLYVGWTRARDRLILAASPAQCLSGLLGTLRDLDPSLLTELDDSRAATVSATWAGQEVAVPVRPFAPSAPVSPVVVPGEVTIPRPAAALAPAMLAPSSAGPVPCRLGVPVVLGPRLPLRGDPEMSAVGDAIHAFLAADRGDADDAVRTARASGLLAAYRVAAHLDPVAVAGAGARLASWLARTGASRVHREWPVAERRASGTLVAGSADLVAEVAGGLLLVDHKTFPGSLEQALARLPRYSGQLAAYASALSAATGLPVQSTWIHLPVLGVVVPIELGPRPAS